MGTRYPIMLVMIVTLMLAGQALSQPRLPAFAPGDVLKASDLNLIVEQIKRHRQELGGTEGVTHTVDCDAGQTIMDAMSQAQPGDTIEISGTCNENVVVHEDGITLDGGGTAVIDGGSGDAAGLIIGGQQNVTVKGLTVQNGLNNIKVVEAAGAWLENVTATGSRFKEGYDSGIGILVSASSSIVLTGDVVANNNAGHGIFVWTSSSAFVISNMVMEGVKIPQTNLQAIGNGGFGMEVGMNGSLHAFSGDTVPTNIKVNNNGDAGINVARGGSVQFGGGVDLEVKGNGGDGMSVVDGSSVSFVHHGSPSRGVSARFNNNKGFAGIAIVRGSSVSMWYWNDAAGGSITAANNSGLGLGIAHNSSFTFDTPLSRFASSNNLVFSNNGDIGMGVYSGSTAILRLPAEIRENTGSGIEMWGNAFVDLGTVSNAPVAIAGNGGNGILSSNGSNLQLTRAEVENNGSDGVGIYNNGFLYCNGSRIAGNGGDGINAWGGAGIGLDGTSLTGNTGSDIWVGGGSRLRAYNYSQVGTITCDDDSVLTYGDVSCPENQ